MSQCDIVNLGKNSYPMHIKSYVKSIAAPYYQWRRRKHQMHQIRKEVHTAFCATSKSPVLVYQMGKVGSQTIYHSLQLADLPNSIFHFHFLSDDIRAVRNYHKKAGIPSSYPFDLAQAVRTELDKQGRKSCLIITLVRDPIAFVISNAFQNPQFINANLANVNGSIDPPKMVTYLTNLLSNPDAFTYMFNWFDRELKRVFLIDIFAQPFPKHVGYTVITGPQDKTLLIRMEDLSRIGCNAISSFLDMPKPLILTPANVGAEKEGGKIYQQVKQMIKLEPAIVNRIYSSTFVRHFYDDVMVQEFTDRWTK